MSNMFGVNKDRNHKRVAVAGGIYFNEQTLHNKMAQRDHKATMHSTSTQPSIMAIPFDSTYSVSHSTTRMMENQVTPRVGLTRSAMYIRHAQITGNRRLNTQPEILDYFPRVGAEDRNPLTGLMNPTTQTPVENPHTYEGVEDNNLSQHVTDDMLNNFGDHGHGNDDQITTTVPMTEVVSVNACVINDANSIMVDNLITLSDPQTVATNEVAGIDVRVGFINQNDGTCDFRLSRNMKSTHPNTHANKGTVFEYRKLALLDENLTTNKPQKLSVKFPFTCKYLTRIDTIDARKVPRALMNFVGVK